MGFARNLANVGTFGLLGAALAKKKKKPVTEPPAPRPTMISNIPLERPISMIGPSRGGY